MNDLLKRLGIGVLIGLAVAIVVALGTQKISFIKELLDGYEFRSYDSRMRANVDNVEEASIDSVVIIDIEQNSIEGLGNYNDWPHAYHGQLIDVVTSGNPKALIFDIIFDPENTFNYDLVNALTSESAPQEEYLSQVTEQYLVSNDPSRFVLSTYESQKVYHALVFESEDTLNFQHKMDSEPEGYDRPDHLIQLPLDQAQRLPIGDRLTNTHMDLISAAKRAGSANFPQDEDGIIRRAPTAIYFEGPKHVYPTLVLAAAMDILGIPADGFDYDFDNLILRLSDTTGTVIREIPIDDQGRMFVNYYGRFKTFYYLPYMYCFDPEMLDPTYWEGKVALVGASLPGLMDLRNTPVQETFAGVEIHANTIHSILQNEFVATTSSQKNFITIVILAVFLGFIVSIPKKPLYTLPVPLLGMLAWTLYTYNQFFTSLVMWEIIRPSISIGGTYLGVFLYNFLVAEKDKRFLKDTFSTYISPELIDQMFEAKEEPQLGGKEGYHTAFFTDIQSFSAFSEKLTATELVELLNDYLTEMTDTLLENKGTLDKYIGDAVMAFFNAPVNLEKHADAACICAISMIEKLNALNEELKAEGTPEIHIGIGLNTAEVIVGNIGSDDKKEYTIIGDGVNLASRVESLTKGYGIPILITEFTVAKLSDNFIYREMEPVKVKGKDEAVLLYELMSKSEKSLNIKKLYDKALQIYIDGDFLSAMKLFEDIVKKYDDNPSKYFLSNIQRNHPWGVTKMTTK